MRTIGLGRVHKYTFYIAHILHNSHHISLKKFLNFPTSVTYSKYTYNLAWAIFLFFLSFLEHPQPWFLIKKKMSVAHLVKVELD